MKNKPEVDLAGTKRWYKEGLRHREDGPAVEYKDGTKAWWYNDLFIGFGEHPSPGLWAQVTSEKVLNGCYEDSNGEKNWFQEGKRHRLDGPAIDGHGEYDFQVWYYEGVALGYAEKGFWELWSKLNEDQRNNPSLLKYLPQCK